MIRGTTAQFKFKLPYALGDLQSVSTQFWQPGNNGSTDAPLPIVKKITTLSGDSNELLVSLMPHETLRFTDRLKARVQLRAQHNNGSVFASRQELITVYDLPDDLMQEDIQPTEEYNGFIVLDGGTIV